MRNELQTTSRLATLVAFVCLLSCVGCSRDAPVESDAHTAQTPFVAAGDMERIRESGKLRVLYPRSAEDSPLPREGNTLELELDLARRFAAQQGVTPVFIYVDARAELIPRLLAGQGDLIAGNLTATRQRKHEVRFTVPVRVVREQLVARSSDPGLHAVADLEGRRVAVRASSSYRETLETLQRRHPGILIQEVPEELNTEEILHRVSQGALDVAVADSNLVAHLLGHRQDLKAAFDLTGDRPVAWAVRPDSPDLLLKLNQFLTAYKLTENNPRTQTGDLPAIRKSRVLRVLTRNSAASYFLWKGELMGFEYDLAKRFAQRHRLRLEMIIPPPGEDLLDWLQQGRGDIVAAALTPTESRIESGNAFSRPYNYVSQVVVTPVVGPAIETLDDLAEHTFHVRRSSSYWETLVRLKAQFNLRGLDFEIVAAPEEMPTEEIIGRVASGDFDLTLADSHILDIEMTWRDNIRGAFPIGDPVELAWAVRDTNPELLAIVNDFIRREYRGLFYNMKYDQYFRNAARIRSQAEQRADSLGGLSPYDDLIKKYAEIYDFDWRLIVAQMHQESRFDPNAHSFAGAVGLMQVLPRTASELGVGDDLRDPEIGIHAGIKYLAWVRERFDPELSIRDRMWFTLAAYNAGPGHVRDARRLAESLGLNPNRWEQNVEEAMLQLSKPKHHRTAPHGYCRCGQAVRYVRDIRQRYNAYLDNAARVAANASSL